MHNDKNNVFKAEFAGGILKLDTRGITIRNGKPGAVFISGSDSCFFDTNSSRCQVSESEVKTFSGKADKKTFLWDDGKNFRLKLEACLLRDIPGLTLKVSFYNGSGSSVKLKDLILLDTGKDNAACEGGKKGWYLSTLTESRRMGSLDEEVPSQFEITQEICGAFKCDMPPIPDEERYMSAQVRSFSDYMCLYKDRGNTGLLMGAVGAPEADINIECHIGAERIGFKAVSDMSGITVEPGSWRESQELLITSMPYNEAVTTVMKWLAASHGSRIKRGPVSGWCSWYDLGFDITAESIDSLAQAYIEKYKNDIRFDVIQVDDGFQAIIGDWKYNEKFPGGLEKFVKTVKSAGIIPGIWLAPLIVHEKTGLKKQHPDWFQKTPSGGDAVEKTNWGGKSHALDPTHPGAREFIKSIILDYKKQGFEYFKIDFTLVDAESEFYDKTKTRLQALRGLYALYRELLGEEIYLMSCFITFTRGTMGYADASRVSFDSCALWRDPNPCNLYDCIRAAGYASFANGIIFATDPDVTYLKPRDGLTDEELRTWHSFVGLNGGITMISEPIQNTQYDSYLRNFEVITPDAPEKAIPLNGACDKEHKLFGFSAKREYGNFATVMLWNSEDKLAGMALDASFLEEKRGDFHAWSFWDEKYLGVARDGSIIEDIAPHGCKILRLTPVSEKNEPLLIGSTLHISMGAAEVKDFNVSSKYITVKLAGSGAKTGKLIISSGENIELHKAANCVVSSVKQTDRGIFEIEISQRKKDLTQEIILSFAK